MRKIIFRGRVSSGKGAGSLFVNLPWARRQFKEKLGFNPYPGTLNLQLSPRTDANRLRDVRKGIKVTPPEGFYKGRCFKAQVMNKMRAAVIVPDIPGYPTNLLEILAPINLREALGLKDGKDVEVTVWLE